MTRSRQLTPEQSAIVGRKLRVLRERAGWTQPDLGKLVGRSVSRVSRMENGQRLFSGEEVAFLAGIFAVTAADFLPECANCAGLPPPGFACIACGAGTPTAVARPVSCRAAVGDENPPVAEFALRGRRRADVSTADIVRLREEEGMSFAAVSARVGLSASGVKYRYAAETRKARGEGGGR